MDNQQQQQTAAPPKSSGGENSKPSRHPILDRLENNDYDFNGQSLDYEPNLEFDDTDLREEIEEELEQLGATDLLALGLRAPDSDPTSESPHLDSQDPEAAAAAVVEGDQPTDDHEYQDALIEHLESQLYLHPQQRNHHAFLESPQDLLEENFEEAFKSSLFELENQQQQLEESRRARTKRQQILLNTNKKSGGKFNSLFKSAASSFYVNKQNLLKSSQSANASAGGNQQQQQGDLLDEFLLSEWDDNFENDDFSDIAQHNCVEVAGDDLFGRRIITIYACRLPSETKIHHIRLLRYIMYTLDQYVENDYCVVYFHYGLNSANKPKLNFLYQAYKAFDRKYKKNLKALFLVHPTNFIRIVWQLFKPVIR